MSMFCYQCQEAAKGTGCTIKGVCGKTDEIAGLQDLLLYVAKGVSYLAYIGREEKVSGIRADKFVFDSLFMTITNANFDDEKFLAQIRRGFEVRAELLKALEEKGFSFPENMPSNVNWRAESDDELVRKSKLVGVLSIEDEDIRSLKELMVYGLKGIAAYAEHAYNLECTKDEVFVFMHKALYYSIDSTIGVDELIAMVLECGQYGVDVYTHSEMLPANYYLKFKKYEHFVGNYGSSWWHQKAEFESFNGPVLLTTNCLVPPSDSYKDRVYTTGSAGFTGVKHIADRAKGVSKDFSGIIEHAKKCAAPLELEQGEIVGGFAHNQVMQLADKVVDAVKSGAIRKFVVMAGCDGRMKDREYYTEFAEKLPTDTVILTAGFAKYRYNKLPLGDIGGIPRILDAGQCNDSYSLAVIALKLKEVFEMNDINDLPIAYNIAWYEQKAVIVLLALLYLGVKNIHLGPTLPAFLSPNVVNVLVENFGIASIDNVDEDIKLLIG